jgi:hypothetical protein
MVVVGSGVAHGLRWEGGLGSVHQWKEAKPCDLLDTLEEMKLSWTVVASHAGSAALVYMCMTSCLCLQLDTPGSHLAMTI